ncbi:MAG TPA: hypothetical protein VN860_03465, partial [Candidatus Acidoferrales bacterium]|nr:hypothetical protein [Candidatus Acidoferrales bacterium]
MTARLVCGGALIGVIAAAYLAATEPEPLRTILMIVAVVAAVAIVIAFVPGRPSAQASVAAEP